MNVIEKTAGAVPPLPRKDLSGVGNPSALVELQRSPPESLIRILRQAFQPDEQVIFSFPVDMNLLGDYSQEWVVVTTRRCAGWEEMDGGCDERFDIALSDLRAVKLRTLTGNHILLADKGEGWEEIVRSSNLTAWKLKPFLQVLEKVVERGPDVLNRIADVELKLPERDVCATCGRIINPHLRVCVACMNKRQILGRMVKLLVPYKLLVALSFALLLAGTFMALLPPMINKAITDLVLVPVAKNVMPGQSFWFRFAPAATVKLLVILGAAQLILLLIPSVVDAVRQYTSSWVGQRIVVDLSNRVFAHMMRLSLSFYHREETGRAMSRITRDVSRIQGFISFRLLSLIRDAAQIVMIVGVLFWMNWRLAAIVLTPVPILVITSEWARRRVHGLYHVLWQRYAAISRFLANTIPGIRVVKAFAQGDREVKRFRTIMDRVFAFEMKTTKVRVTISPIIQMTTRFGSLLVFIAGGAMVISSGGEEPGMTMGKIVAFSSFMGMFYGPMTELARMLPEFERAATSADRVFEILDSEPDLESEERTVEMPPSRGRVECDRVTFGYEPDEPVLHDLTFTVQPGEMIGLVGHSGAGKTTLINLVCHFYKVDEGCVLVDGLNLAEVKVESLRRQIGIVSQDPFLFSGTIADNIAYGKPGASEREVIAAATAANAHEFIVKFPEGYDTLVGERGARISGGERQRVAIARAILKDPRILILDEATSSVDTATEEKIQQALSRLVAGRTTFAIAHRISTLKFADRLLALEHGRLVEMGTHDELIALGGVYANLCKKQTDLYRLTAWSE